MSDDLTKLTKAMQSVTMVSHCNEEPLQSHVVTL